MSKECPVCGKTCKSEKGVSIHKARLHGAPWHDREKLIEEYHDNGLSTYEMADLWDCSQEAIIDAMRRMEIPRRKVRKDPTIGATHRFDKHNPQVGGTYEFVSTWGSNKRVQVHRLVAFAHGKMDFEDLCNPNIVVHHKSRHGLDNRPENLEVMDRSEHSKHHASMKNNS